MRRAYIAGPMTGMVEWNFPLFAEVTAAVRAMGWEAVSPAEHSLEEGADINATSESLEQRYKYLRWDIGVLIDPTTTDIVMLPGWQTSAGAILERSVALAVGLTINCWNGQEVVEVQCP